MSAVKLTLDNFKNARQRQGVELKANPKKVVIYTVTYGKTFCSQEEKTKWKRKMD